MANHPKDPWQRKTVQSGTLMLFYSLRESCKKLMEVGFRGETYRRKTDGSCSAAELNSPTGTGFNVRPLRLLYQLEVQDTVSDHEETNSEDINSTSDPQKRKATIEARQKIHMWTQ